MSVMKLLKNVELDSNYESTIDFDNSTSQLAYFNSLVASGDTINDVLFIRNDDKVTTRLEMALDDAREYNYCMFQNDNDTRWYYGFIISTTFINPAVTEFYIEVDVMQTFMFDIQLESAWIEREHQDRVRLPLVPTNPLEPIYNIENELIEVGTEYDVEKIKKYAQKDFGDGTYLVWAMFLWKQQIDESTIITTSQVGSNNSCTISFHPFILGKEKTSGTLDTFIYNVSGGSDISIPTADNFIQRVNTNTQLESAYIVPYLPSTISKVVYTITKVSTNSYRMQTSSTHNDYLVPVEYLHTGSGGLDPIVDTAGIYGLVLVHWEGQKEDVGSIDIPTLPVVVPSLDANGQIQQNANIDYETKLNTFPYRSMQLMSNNSVKEYKYEFTEPLINNRLLIRELYYDMPILQIGIRNYNGDGTLNREGIVDRTINELILKIDPYAEYMRNQKSQAITGIGIASANAMASIIPSGNVNLNTGMNYGHMITDNTPKHNFKGSTGASSTMGNMATMSPTNDILRMQNGTMDVLGKCANFIALKEDLRRTPDTLRSMGNNSTLSCLSETIIPTIYHLKIKDYYLNKCYNYFRLFGYKSNRFTYNGDGKGLNYRSRYYYNYIRCIDCKLHANINKTYIDTIEGIFERGITIWHKRTGMTTFNLHNYAKENWEVSVLGTLPTPSV